MNDRMPSPSRFVTMFRAITMPKLISANIQNSWRPARPVKTVYCRITLVYQSITLFSCMLFSFSYSVGLVPRYIFHDPGARCCRRGPRKYSAAAWSGDRTLPLLTDYDTLYRKVVCIS